MMQPFQEGGLIFFSGWEAVRQAFGLSGGQAVVCWVDDNGWRWGSVAEAGTSSSLVSAMMIYLSLALSWLANANLAAFSCSLANLFSYLDTFFSVGLMNLPFMSLTDMLSSLIWRSRKMTSRCKKNISPSRLNHLSKYSLTMFFSSSSEALSMSFLTPHRSAMILWRSVAFLSCSFFNSSAAFLRNRVRSFFFLSGVMNPFFLVILKLRGRRLRSLIH